MSSRPTCPRPAPWEPTPSASTPTIALDSVLIFQEGRFGPIGRWSPRLLRPEGTLPFGGKIDRDYFVGRTIALQIAIVSVEVFLIGNSSEIDFRPIPLPIQFCSNLPFELVHFWIFDLKILKTPFNSLVFSSRTLPSIRFLSLGTSLALLKLHNVMALNLREFKGRLYGDHRKR